MKLNKLLPLLIVCAFIACKKEQNRPGYGKKKETTSQLAKKSELLEKSEIIFQPISAVKIAHATEDKITLGKKLYFDKRLSKDGNISCNSCHQLDNYGVDNLSKSPGDLGKLGGRNSPTVIYAALHAMQFWDGRAKDLEEQAGGPVLNPVEHNIPSEAFLEKRLRKVTEYQELFKKAFPDQKQPVTFKNMQQAISAFETELLPKSNFDKFLEGDESALTATEKSGLKLFLDNGCVACHSGVALGGQMFQKFGVFGNYWDYTKSKKIDNGLYDITKKEFDKYKFKVPGLRNIAKTNPYFHDGSVNSLHEAVKIMAKIQTDKDLTTKEVDDIVAFLNSLTADIDPKYKS